MSKLYITLSEGSEVKEVVKSDDVEVNPTFAIEGTKGTFQVEPNDLEEALKAWEDSFFTSEDL